VLTELADDLSYGIASLREAQERQRVQRQLEHQAAFDPLTGLANRCTLEARLQQSIADARPHGQRLALLFVDLDRFKLVNDTPGHGSGDQLLRAMAQRLRGAVRECDTVARLGSDEFAVLLNDVRSAAEAGALAATVLQALGTPQTITGCELHPSASVGVGVFPEDGSDLGTLMRNAGTAMGTPSRWAAGGCTSSRRR
jgi:diguanylate cyclase (GGDEF)-like protein